MRSDEARIGARVRSLVAFAGVPEGTEGVIDEDYDTGVMVAWDLADRPLPAGYASTVRLTGRQVRGGLGTRPLRDGFDKSRELQFLELVR